ncbi:MAG: sulfatase-like hydrolase/transferase, partial [Bacteroidales bacterium]|nr:sulfatase-like hydrolase/transferase [Bacteroidales bacterium]
MHFSFHRDDFQFISILLKRLLFVLIVYTAFRWLFYVFNISIFGTISAKEIIDIVVGGLRFDLSVIAYSNSLVILLMVIPFSFRKFKCYHQIVFSLFVIVNSFAWLIATADIEYYSYNNRRMTLDLFLLVDEVDFTFRDIFIKYWYLIGLFLLSVTSLIIADIRLNSYQKATRYQNHILHSGLCIITLGLSFFAARGAFTGRPLTAINASNYALFEKSSLVTNSPFVFMHSLDMKRIDHTEYFPPAELPEHFTTTRSYNNALRNENMNIVIIVWESLSADFIGKLNEYPGFTPFLDSILNEALVFKNAYANAKRSTEGIPAILSSFPSLVNVAYVRSSYQDNCITGISYYLKKRNYHCSFFHGGNRGTMNFYSFSKKIGFDEYYGREEFSDETYYDGHWGIYDENFMQYYGEQLNAFPQPFLSVILTLSSHHPFNLPEKYQGKFKSGRQPGICEAISYADYSLQRFFEQVSSYKWFTNTLFVITADHPHKLNEHELESYNT